MRGKYFLDMKLSVVIVHILIFSFYSKSGISTMAVDKETRNLTRCWDCVFITRHHRLLLSSTNSLPSYVSIRLLTTTDLLNIFLDIDHQISIRHIFFDKVNWCSLLAVTDRYFFFNRVTYCTNGRSTDKVYCHWVFWHSVICRIFFLTIPFIFLLHQVEVWRRRKSFL